MDFIEEAKIRYPIGTKFKPAHLGEGNCIVTNTNFKDNNGDIFALTDEGTINASSGAKYGDSWARVVYDSGLKRWAEITESGKKFRCEVVRCKTKEQWDFVLDKIGNPKNLKGSNFRTYSEELVIAFNSEDTNNIGRYAIRSYDSVNTDRILTFEEWCKEFGHTTSNSMPDYVECTKVWRGSVAGVSVVGKIYKTSEENDFSCHTFQGIWDGDASSSFKDYFKPATKEAYDKQFNKSSTGQAVEVKSESGLKFLRTNKLEIKFVD